MNDAKTAMKSSQKECQECGTAFQCVRDHAAFCSDRCRKAFNNRRMVRGAELYDIAMTMRYERGLSKAKFLWSLFCAVCSAYRDADKALRGGRKSWVSGAYERIPLAYSSQGDRR